MNGNQGQPMDCAPSGSIGGSASPGSTMQFHASEGPPRAEIGLLVDELQSRCSLLEEATDMLTNKLATVLREPTPSPADDTASVCKHTLMGRELDASNARLMVVAERLGDLIGRLEV